MCHHPATAALVATDSWNVPLGWQKVCPITQQHPPTSLNATLPHQHASWLNPPPALISPVPAKRSVETNGGELLGGEDAAGAALSKATSHLLSLSHQCHYCPPPQAPPFSPPRATATLVTGGVRGTLQGLLCYQHAPALKWAGPESGLCLLEGISLVVCVSLR